MLFCGSLFLSDRRDGSDDGKAMGEGGGGVTHTIFSLKEEEEVVVDGEGRLFSCVLEKVAYLSVGSIVHREMCAGEETPRRAALRVCCCVLYKLRLALQMIISDGITLSHVELRSMERERERERRNPSSLFCVYAYDMSDDPPSCNCRSSSQVLDVNHFITLQNRPINICKEDSEGPPF